MKQHITKKQRGGLNKKGQIAYFKWCWEKGLVEKTGPIRTRDLPLLSIGRMIEFLGDHKNLSNFHSLESCHETPGAKGWHVVVKDLFVKGDFLTFDEEELCDALWKAVKEVLNK